MKLLLKNALIVDKSSAFHLKKRDLFIDKGRIQEIGVSLKPTKAKTIDLKGACIAPGFIDLNCHIYEPGFEYREDINSGLSAAANGGYTSVAYMPNTYPVIDNRAQISFVKSKSQKSVTRVMPVGAVSKELGGKHLAEIYEMHDEGAIAFSDGSKSIQDSGLLERALLYVKRFNGLVMHHPDDNHVARDGHMSEGEMSTKLGLHAAPTLAEELQVARDVYLLEHTQSKLHVINVSTAKSVALIKQAKSKGLKITAGVNAFNLLLDEEALADFNTHYKVNPHLRTKKDVKALIKGLKDGVIDVINSGHMPRHEDEKKVAFDNAKFGMSALDTAFAVARTATEKVLDLDELIDKFGANGAKVLGFENAGIEKGGIAVLTVFEPNQDNAILESDIKSKSKQTPFIGMTLKGKVLGVVNKKKTNLL